jgi:large subunit ribosomal protein L25
MESIKISANARVDLGKKGAKALRREEKVPCVLYGSENVVHFAIPALSFRNLVYTSDVYKVELDVDGTTYSALLKDVQFHPVTDKIIHADFIQLVDGVEVTTEVPVRLTGNAKGVATGGKLRKNMRKLRVRSIPANLPSDISVDVTSLNIGEKVRVSDVETKGFDILNAANAVIAAVKTARGAVKAGDEEEEEAAAAE